MHCDQKSYPQAVDKSGIGATAGAYWGTNWGTGNFFIIGISDNSDV